MFITLGGIRFNLDHIIDYYEDSAEITIVITTRNKHNIQMPIAEVDRLLREAYITVKG